jgi:gas vesicle protein
MNPEAFTIGVCVGGAVASVAVWAIAYAKGYRAASDKFVQITRNLLRDYEDQRQKISLRARQGWENYR